MKYISLNELADGERGVIAKLAASGPIKQRLMDLGIIPGTEVKVIRSAPLGDPIQIRSGRCLLSIRRLAAAGIFLERKNEYATYRGSCGKSQLRQDHAL